jgi:hypothetical protein
MSLVGICTAPYMPNVYLLNIVSTILKFTSRLQMNIITLLLPFAIMLAKLPFWAQIKNLRTRCREPHKSTSSGRKNIIVSDLKRYDKGLPEYVKN